MRVLHVMECTIGGTRRHLVDVALGQRALGLDVHVTAAVSRQPDFESDLQRLERAGVVVTRLAMVRAIAPLKDARHLTALRRQLERVRPDIVHTHASKAGVLGRLASIQSDVGKRVHTPHTFAFLFEAEFSRPKRALFRCVERALASHTHAMIAVSASEARTFTESEVVDRERVRIVQNGIDARGWIEAIPIDRAALGVVGEDLLVLVIGLLNVAKGQDIALSALAKPGLDDVHIAIVGHGDMESQLRGDASRLGIEKRVHFLGFRTDVPRLVAACDFVLLPSRWEGMPYVVLEAMAGAKPVVATPVDGAVDLVSEGRTGFVARAIDAGAVAEALRAMSALTSRERAAMGSVGRARVLEHHGVDAMVKQLVDVYEEVR
ncbi:MAG: glycosyltransferase family 4 protein [Planctomycetota bacterium]|nr:glycosyltransferase family 4 protein [Planctomycetota bacterium]